MCPAQPLSPLIEHFQSLEDPRCSHLVEHRLLDILGLTLCAVICGADSWVDMAAYGRAKEEWLRGFLSLPHGIPSHDTIARLFAALDPEAFQGCFVAWVKAVAPLGSGEQIAIDGKTLRHSYDRGGSKGAIHMVSAWANEQRLVLAQGKVDEKSNEITAIPELLRVLGCLVTIDAMGTQTIIAQQIIEGGGDYILSLKGNQGNLHDDVEQVFNWARQQAFQDMPHEFHQTITHGHGRIDIRRHWLLDGVEHLFNAERWVGLKRVGLVEAERVSSANPRKLSSATIWSASTAMSNALPRECAATGALKINSIGCSMSPSRKMPPEFVKTTPQQIWPSSATAPSICSVRTPPPKGASRLKGRAQK